MSERQSRQARDEERDRAERIAKAVRAERAQELASLMRDPEFRRFMHQLLGELGMLRTVMTGSSHTYHKAGMQDAAHLIFAKLASVDEQSALSILHSKNGEEFYVRSHD